MSVICVTGQMAAGKNYICSQYEKEGWISIDADKVVHEAVEECKSQIIEVFGEIAKSKGIELLDEDGKIIRRNLGSLIFGNADLLKKQEDIVYPYVTDYIKNFIEKHSQKPNPNKDSDISSETPLEDGKIIINATVLYKTPELLNLCEKIVFVKASFFKRLLRAKKRDKLPFSKIISRFRSQKNLFSFYMDSGIPVEIVKN